MQFYHLLTLFVLTALNPQPSHANNMQGYTQPIVAMATRPLNTPCRDTPLALPNVQPAQQPVCQGNMNTYLGPIPFCGASNESFGVLLPDQLLNNPDKKVLLKAFDTMVTQGRVVIYPSWHITTPGFFILATPFLNGAHVIARGYRGCYDKTKQGVLIVQTSYSHISVPYIGAFADGNHKNV